jgi:DNA-directed RNA polymerase subunit RPC12/RpoP
MYTNISRSFFFSFFLFVLDISWRGRGKYVFGKLKCCGEYFVNLGALAQHEFHKHKDEHKKGGRPAMKSQRRHSYPLRFKAMVVEAAEDLLALKCTKCGVKQTDDLLQRHLTEEEREANDGDEGRCPACGHNEFEKKAKYQ